MSTTLDSQGGTPVSIRRRTSQMDQSSKPGPAANSIPVLLRLPDLGESAKSAKLAVAASTAATATPPADPKANQATTEAGAAQQAERMPLPGWSIPNEWGGVLAKAFVGLLLTGMFVTACLMIVGRTADKDPETDSSETLLPWDESEPLEVPELPTDRSEGPERSQEVPEMPEVPQDRSEAPQREARSERKPADSEVGSHSLLPNRSQDRHTQDRHTQDRHTQDRHTQDRHTQDRHADRWETELPLELEPPISPQVDSMGSDVRIPDRRERELEERSGTAQRQQDPERYDYPVTDPSTYQYPQNYAPARAPSQRMGGQDEPDGGRRQALQQGRPDRVRLQGTIEPPRLRARHEPTGSSVY